MKCYELGHSNFYKLTFAASEDSDHPAQLCSLTRVFAVHIKKFGFLAIHTVYGEDFVQTMQIHRLMT